MGTGGTDQEAGEAIVGKGIEELGTGRGKDWDFAGKGRVPGSAQGLAPEVATAKEARLDPAPEVATAKEARLDPAPEVATAIADHQELEEEVDPQGLEEVDLEGPVAHRCEKAIQPRRNLHSPIAPDFHPNHFQ